MVSRGHPRSSEVIQGHVVHTRILLVTMASILRRSAIAVDSWQQIANFIPRLYNARPSAFLNAV